MDRLSTYEKILQAASDLLDAVRTFLSVQLNIDLPLWLAHGIVLALFLPILCLLIKKIAKTRKVGARLAMWMGIIAAGAISFMILLTWVTYLAFPLLEQIEGEVVGIGPDVSVQSLRVELLDFKGESLGARVNWISGTHHFLLNYLPDFADPPRKIVVKGGGCKGERRPRHSELTKGTILSLNLQCGSS
jgi:hypothetical protein